MGASANRDVDGSQGPSGSQNTVMYVSSITCTCPTNVTRVCVSREN